MGQCPIVKACHTRVHTLIDTRLTLKISMKLSHITITNTEHKENFKVFLEKMNFFADVTQKLGQN
jgi:hypothetical protein